MANTGTPFKRFIPSEQVTLAHLLQEHARNINLDLNCHSIAQIQSFDAAKQTCVAKINYKKTNLKRNTDGTYSDVYVDYPILVDVPVVILSGGNAALTFPIEAGDDCLILFNDRDIDNWITSGQNLQLNSNRLHDMNDAFALVGIRNFSNSIDSYDQTRVKLFKGDAMVGVSDNQVKIANSLYTLNGILQDLITALQTAPLVAATGTPGNPSPINPAITVLLTTVSAKLSNLLE